MSIMLGKTAKLGQRVKMIQGVKGGWIGKKIHHTNIIVNERGIPVRYYTGCGSPIITAPLNQGHYKPVNWRDDVAVQWDNGEIDVCSRADLIAYRAPVVP